MFVLEPGAGFKVFGFFLVRIQIFDQLIKATPETSSRS
jgi:hypothetical protein